MPSQAIIDILRSGRGNFNAKFELASKRYAKLDGPAFLKFFATLADDVAVSIEKVAPDSLSNVAQILYEYCLDLMGQGLLGAGSKYPAIQRAWCELLPRVPAALAANPKLTIRIISNGAHTLSTTEGGRADEWVTSLVSLVDNEITAEVLAQLGQIVAWKSGFAHYRGQALELIKTLPDSLRAKMLGNAALDQTKSANILAALKSNPWLTIESALTPGIPAEKPAQLKIMKRVGSFRGFSGSFLVPPVVAQHPNGFLVQSDKQRLLLAADCYGATFHRLDTPEIHAALTSISKSGEVSFEGKKQKFEELKECTSSAVSASTLAVTTKHSHHIYLLAA